MSGDSIVIDSAQLAVWRENPRYDYDRELVDGGQNLLEWLWETLAQWFFETFDEVLSNDVTYYTLIVVGAFLLAFLVWVIWKKNPRLFRRNEDKALDYETSEDTIYGIDFDEAIANAVAGGDYRQAVRLIYLQTLKHLSDGGHIDWQPSRTPLQYMRQMDSKPFHDLTRHFIRVRYGNFEATDQLFQEMKALQSQTIATAAPTRPTVPPSGFPGDARPTVPPSGSPGDVRPTVSPSGSPNEEKGGTP